MTLASNSDSAAPEAFQSEFININEEESLNYWVTALECSELQLRVAVAEVGPEASEVGDALGRRMTFKPHAASSRMQHG
jgi:hypothetical protein